MTNGTTRVKNIMGAVTWAANLIKAKPGYALTPKEYAALAQTIKRYDIAEFRTLNSNVVEFILFDDKHAQEKLNRTEINGSRYAVIFDSAEQAEPLGLAIYDI